MIAQKRETMYLRTRLLFVVLFTISFFVSSAQYDTLPKPLRIAVVAPLYLDSAFNGYSYTLSQTSIPKMFLPGLEFYNGVMMAVDSLEKENVKAEVWIYDSRKEGQTTQSLVNEMQGHKFSFVIASIGNAAEQKVFSDYSFNNTIPFISATYPNDANITGNPMFLMVNPTWKTHVGAVAKYIKDNYPTAKTIVVTKTGALEDRILKELNDAKSKKNMPSFTAVSLSDDLTADDLLPSLDKTKQNVIICGSLNEEFGKNLIKTLNGVTGYSNVLIGMPTWHGMSGTTGSNCKNITLVYTTPYNYRTYGSRIATLSANYKDKYNASPGDMVFKGYETMYHFTRLYQQQQGNFIIKTSEPSYKVANDYNFVAVRQNENSVLPDYQENKKIYFIKVVNGAVQSVN